MHLHARIAEALEALYGGQVEAHAAELAHHYAEAATVTGTERLVHYSLIAGERALASHAYEEALAFFQRGLSAKRGAGQAGMPALAETAPDADTAGLLFGLGRAQIATLPLHQIPEAVATLRRAFDYYERVGDVTQAVMVAEHPLPIKAGVVTGARELTGRALALVTTGSPEAARLLSLHGRLLGLEAGDLSAAQEALRQALEIAERTGDPVLEMRTLVDGADVDIYHGDWSSGLKRAFRAVELAPRANDPRSEMLAHYWAALPLALVTGEPDLASQHAAASLVAAERLRHHFYLARALIANAWPISLKGDWAASRAFGAVRRPGEGSRYRGSAILRYYQS